MLQRNFLDTSFIHGFTAATMKTFLNLIFLLVGVSISSAQVSNLSNFDLRCVTSFPTTSFIGDTANGKFSVRLVNHNGVAYMPIHSGLVTSRDLPLLQEQAEALKILGSEFRFSFPLKDCVINGDGTFNCFSPTEDLQIIEGKKVSIFSLSSIQSTIRFSGVVHDSVQIMAGLEIDKKSYFVTMEYMPNECDWTPQIARKL